MKKYRIRNVTTSTPQEEIAYGDSPEQLIATYAMVEEKIEIIEELPDDTAPNQTSVPTAQPQGGGGEPNGPVDPLMAVIPDDPFVPTLTHGQPAPEHEPVYYEMGGQKLMMKGGILYHKVWKDVENPDDYQIMSTKTGKLITKEHKVIQILSWEPVESEDESTGEKGEEGVDADV